LTIVDREDNTGLRGGLAADVDKYSFNLGWHSNRLPQYDIILGAPIKKQSFYQKDQ